MDNGSHQDIVSYVNALRSIKNRDEPVQKQKIDLLIVEDDREDYELLRDYLGEVRGSRYHLNWRRDYTSGLEALRNATFDVCLIDYRLGESSGLELLKNAKESGIATPMILLTGHGDHDLDLAAMRAGAVDFIDKTDLHPNILERTIRYAIKHHQDMQQLKLRKQNFATIFDLVLEGIIVHDGVVIRDANQTALAMFGATRKDEMLGHSFLELFDNASAAALGNARIQGNTTEVELRGRRRDGTTVWVEYASRSVTLEGQRMQLCAIRDITQKKRAEEQTKLAESARIEKEAAQAANDAKSDFLAHMSHEIRTPLGAIMGFIDLASMEGTAENKRAEWLRIAKNSAQHLLALINQILDLAKVEANHFEIDRSEFNLQELLADVTNLMGHQAEKKRLAFRVRSTTDLPVFIQCDRLRLKQILINLIGNAIKFTSTGGVTVDVQAEKMPVADKSLLKFTVSDTGIGIAPEAQHRLFRAFSQATPQTTAYGGSGLGLALSREIAEIMGGALRLMESTPGQGSVFRLELPVGLSFLAAAATTPMESQPTDTLANDSDLDNPQRKLAGAKILLAEDTPENQILISAYLERVGATVVVADNGLAAVAAAQDEDFDLVIMDLQMPELGGYEALDRLRQIRYSKPVIALTAHAMTTEAERALNMGFRAYLTKPINPDLLYSTLASLLV